MVSVYNYTIWQFKIEQLDHIVIHIVKKEDGSQKMRHESWYDVTKTGHIISFDAIKSWPWFLFVLLYFSLCYIVSKLNKSILLKFGLSLLDEKEYIYTFL